jgi:hypothetical protein
MSAVIAEPTAPRQSTGDEVSAARFALMADKIEADPSLLEIPLANIARWLALGHSSADRMEGWRNMIQEACDSADGMRRLLALLRDQSWEALLWKGFSPFPGILTLDDIKRLLWNSRH